MANPNLNYIKYTNNDQEMDFEVVGKDIDATWFDVLSIGLVALSLQGHESILFKASGETNNKFTEPLRSASHPLRKICKLDVSKLQLLLQYQMSPLLGSIFNMTTLQLLVLKPRWISHIHRKYLPSLSSFHQGHSVKSTWNTRLQLRW